jgi:PII-like signaling protein
MVFLSEDDRVGHHSAADTLLQRARAAGLSGATIWRGIEGFGASGHVRAARLPDLARGLPLVVELIDDEQAIADFLPVVRELANGALVTTETVHMSRSPVPNA